MIGVRGEMGIWRERKMAWRRNLEKGDFKKKSASGERRGFFLLKENDKYGTSPQRIFFKIHWFSP